MQSKFVQSKFHNGMRFSSSISNLDTKLLILNWSELQWDIFLIILLFLIESFLYAWVDVHFNGYVWWIELFSAHKKRKKRKSNSRLDFRVEEIIIFIRFHAQCSACSQAFLSFCLLYYDEEKKEHETWSHYACCNTHIIHLSVHHSKLNSFLEEKMGI